LTSRVPGANSKIAHFKVTIHSRPGDFLASPTALSAHPKVQVPNARRHTIHRQQALLGKKLGEAGAGSRRRRQKALYLRHKYFCGREDENLLLLRFIKYGRACKSGPDVVRLPQCVEQSRQPR
jgi:hypothetical protein